MSKPRTRGLTNVYQPQHNCATKDCPSGDSHPCLFSHTTEILSLNNYIWKPIHKLRIKHFLLSTVYETLSWLSEWIKVKEKKNKNWYSQVDWLLVASHRVVDLGDTAEARRSMITKITCQTRKHFFEVIFP